jgi:glucose-6-phosphate isomerase
MIKFQRDETVPQKQRLHLSKNLVPAIAELSNEIKKKYSTRYAAFSLATDKKLITKILNLSRKYSDVEVLIIIGIGGSNLGTMAVYEALKGKIEKEDAKKVYFLDTVDTPQMHSVLEVLISSIQQKKKILVNVISKSGTTIETVANFGVILSLLEWYGLPAHENVLITSDRGSKLWNFAENKYIPRVEIPAFVGGRYSVFSAVSLLPLAILGIDIKALCRGAASMSAIGVMSPQKNIAAQSAIDVYYNYSHGRNIAELLLFGSSLESLGKWYRQLLAESTGKQHNKSKREIWTGITPTVAIGSTDLHSMAQLYLGGPRDKFMTIVLPEYSRSPKVPKSDDFKSLLPEIQKKSLQQIMFAINKGFVEAIKNQHRPFNQIKMSTSPESIGAFMQFKMFEVVYISHLLHVNPFDQPNVEDYKTITRRMLK